MAVVATTAIGSEGRARPSRGRVRETRERVGEDERETWGSRGVLWASPGVGRSRRWPARGEHAPFVLLARGGRRLAAPAGWAEPGGWASTGKAQVGFLLSFFFDFCFCFLFNCNCLALNKILKRFQKS